MARQSHAAVCLGYGGDHPQLLVTGGLDKDCTVLSDIWVLDLQFLRWKEVSREVCSAHFILVEWIGMGPK